MQTDSTCRPRQLFETGFQQRILRVRLVDLSNLFEQQMSFVANRKDIDFAVHRIAIAANLLVDSFCFRLQQLAHFAIVIGKLMQFCVERDSCGSSMGYSRNS